MGNEGSVDRSHDAPSEPVKLLGLPQMVMVMDKYFDAINTNHEVQNPCSTCCRVFLDNRPVGKTDTFPSAPVYLRPRRADAIVTLRFYTMSPEDFLVVPFSGSVRSTGSSRSVASEGRRASGSKSDQQDDVNNIAEQIPGELHAEIAFPLKKLIDYGAPLYSSMWLGFKEGKAVHALGDMHDAIRNAANPEVARVCLTVFRPARKNRDMEKDQSPHPTPDVNSILDNPEWDFCGVPGEKIVSGKVQIEGLIRCLHQSNMTSAKLGEELRKVHKDLEKARDLQVGMELDWETRLHQIEQGRNESDQHEMQQLFADYEEIKRQMALNDERQREYFAQAQMVRHEKDILQESLQKAEENLQKTEKQLSYASEQLSRLRMDALKYQQDRSLATSEGKNGEPDQEQRPHIQQVEHDKWRLEHEKCLLEEKLAATESGLAAAETEVRRLKFESQSQHGFPEAVIYHGPAGSRQHVHEDDSFVLQQKVLAQQHELAWQAQEIARLQAGIEQYHEEVKHSRRLLATYELADEERRANQTEADENEDRMLQPPSADHSEFFPEVGPDGESSYPDAHTAHPYINTMSTCRDLHKAEEKRNRGRALEEFEQFQEIVKELQRVGEKNTALEAQLENCEERAALAPATPYPVSSRVGYDAEPQRDEANHLHFLEAKLAAVQGENDLHWKGEMQQLEQDHQRQQQQQLVLQAAVENQRDTLWDRLNEIESQLFLEEEQIHQMEVDSERDFEKRANHSNRGRNIEMVQPVQTVTNANQVVMTQDTDQEDTSPENLIRRLHAENAEYKQRLAEKEQELEEVKSAVGQLPNQSSNANAHTDSQIEYEIRCQELYEELDRIQGDLANQRDNQEQVVQAEKSRAENLLIQLQTAEANLHALRENHAQGSEDLTTQAAQDQEVELLREETVAQQEQIMALNRKVSQSETEIQLNKEIEEKLMKAKSDLAGARAEKVALEKGNVALEKEVVSLRDELRDQVKAMDDLYVKLNSAVADSQALKCSEAFGRKLQRENSGLKSELQQHEEVAQQNENMIVAMEKRYALDQEETASLKEKLQKAMEQKEQNSKDNNCLNDADIAVKDAELGHPKAQIEPHHSSSGTECDNSSSLDELHLCLANMQLDFARKESSQQAQNLHKLLLKQAEDLNADSPIRPEILQKLSLVNKDLLAANSELELLEGSIKNRKEIQEVFELMENEFRHLKETSQQQRGFFDEASSIHSELQRMRAQEENQCLAHQEDVTLAKRQIEELCEETELQGQELEERKLEIQTLLRSSLENAREAHEQREERIAALDALHTARNTYTSTQEALDTVHDELIELTNSRSLHGDSYMEEFASTKNELACAQAELQELRSKNHQKDKVKDDLVASQQRMKAHFVALERDLTLAKQELAEQRSEKHEFNTSGSTRAAESKLRTVDVMVRPPEGGPTITAQPIEPISSCSAVRTIQARSYSPPRLRAESEMISRVSKPLYAVPEGLAISRYTPPAPQSISSSSSLQSDRTLQIYSCTTTCEPSPCQSPPAWPQVPLQLASQVETQNQASPPRRPQIHGGQSTGYQTPTWPLACPPRITPQHDGMRHTIAVPAQKSPPAGPYI